VAQQGHVGGQEARSDRRVSSRWVGAMTRASHDQWALARRCQAAHLANRDAGIATIRYRLSLPVADKGR